MVQGELQEIIKLSFFPYHSFTIKAFTLFSTILPPNFVGRFPREVEKNKKKKREMVLYSSFTDVSTWVTWQVVTWYGVILTGLETVANLVFPVGKMVTKKLIPERGQHLDELSTRDRAYISFNKCITPIFAYHVVRLIWSSPSYPWGITEITFSNTIICLLCMFVIYDFFYYWFHRFLHLKFIYPWVHKVKSIFACFAFQQNYFLLTHFGILKKSNFDKRTKKNFA